MPPVPTSTETTSVLNRTSSPLASASTTDRYPSRGNSPSTGPPSNSSPYDIQRNELLSARSPASASTSARSAWRTRRATAPVNPRSATYASIASSPVAAGPSRSLSASTASQKPSDSCREYFSVSARSRCRRSARSYADSVGIGSPGSRTIPSSSQSADIGLPTGWWIHEPPKSTGAPARSTVCSRPPMRSRASSTTHGMPARHSRDAAASPAMPAPTTTTRSTGPTISLTAPYFAISLLRDKGGPAGIYAAGVGTQLPWNPAGTRCGTLMLATSCSVCASRIASSLRSAAWS